jgi:hypothetical protein
MQRVLVGRYASSVNAAAFPLIADPESGKVEVIATPLGSSSEIRPVGHGGAVYWTMPWSLNAAGGQEIWRLSIPELMPQSLGKRPLATRSQYVGLAMEEGKVHLVQQQWHTSASWEESLTPLRGKIPAQEYERLLPLHSAIHGWLLMNANQSRVLGVEFKESP